MKHKNLGREGERAAFHTQQWCLFSAQPTLRAEVLRSSHIPEGDLSASIHFVRILRVNEDGSRRFPHLNILQELHPKKAQTLDQTPMWKSTTYKSKRLEETVV